MRITRRTTEPTIRSVALAFVCAALSGCITDVMLVGSCAIQAPVKLAQVGSTTRYELLMNIDSGSSSYSDSVIVSCTVVDHSCHAGEMGWAEIFEMHPPNPQTLSVEYSPGIVFRVGTPNCSAITDVHENGGETDAGYSYWREPEIVTDEGAESVPIWYPEHREKLFAVGIDKLLFKVVRQENRK